MKVLQVLNHFLPSQIAGTEVYTWALSKQLQQKGIDVQVIIPSYGKNLDSEYIYDGLYVKKYAEPSVVNRSLIMGYRPPDGLNNFISYLDQFKPDIVHFHELAGSNGITLKHIQAAKISGSKVIMTFHLAGYSCKTGTLVYKGRELCDGIIKLKKCSICYLQGRTNSKLVPILTEVSNILFQASINSLKWNNKLSTALGTVAIINKLKFDLNTLITNCDRVVAISKWYEQVLLANSVDQQKIIYIPQGLPFSNDDTSLKKNHPIRPLRLLFIGRINKFKGLHLLLSALTNVNSNMVELSVYGNSDDELYEKTLRTFSNPFNNINWKGRLNQSEVIPTMKQHDVLCLCSTFSEMNPLVIQEAFEAGIPVIASNVYGNSEQIIHEKNGLLFKYNDVKDLQNQIVRCIKEPSLVNNLSQNIKKPYSFTEVANKYYDLYKTLLS
ncbi:MAG: hypothetical protein RLZ10_2287 [Bacteroidota bacterium]|jgi:glycosyltransferase involved in cell wall biosynthesis